MRYRANVHALKLRKQIGLKFHPVIELLALAVNLFSVAWWVANTY
jgi:hypothetical protein